MTRGYNFEFPIYLDGVAEGTIEEIVKVRGKFNGSYIRASLENPVEYPELEYWFVLPSGQEVLDYEDLKDWYPGHFVPIKNKIEEQCYDVEDDFEDVPYTDLDDYYA